MRTLPAADARAGLARVSGALDRLERWITNHGPAGSDPYDGLNSPWARAAGLFGRWGRIAFLQLVRRSPRLLRPLALIPHSINPKGLALLAQAYLDLHLSRGDTGYLERAREHLEWLEHHASTAVGTGWGYPFDWSARAFFVPRNTPSIVVTATVGKVFLEASQRMQEPRLLDVARNAAAFVGSGLNRSESEHGMCFSYTPLDQSRIYNASLLGASLLARVAAQGDPSGDLLELARRATRFVLARQNDDGSWCYGDAPFHRWIDGHHTGFILRDLGEIRAATGWPELDSPLDGGMKFYRERLLAPDGRPLFRVDRPWPADIHACAEAVLVLSDPNLRGASTDPLGRALEVVDWTVQNLQRPDGAFGYLKHPGRTDWTPHLRWGQAWMLHALARLEGQLSATPATGGER